MEKFGRTKCAVLAAFTTISINSFTVPAFAQDLVPLKLYWSNGVRDNFVTATPQGESDAIGSGYKYIRTEACVFRSQKAGLVPLNLYWSGARAEKDNFTTATTQGKSDAIGSGYSFVPTEGYVYSTQQPGTIPLKLYWSGHRTDRKDNFTTGTKEGTSDALGSDYVFVRVEGYAYPVTKCQ